MAMSRDQIRAYSPYPASPRLLIRKGTMTSGGMIWRTVAPQMIRVLAAMRWACFMTSRHAEYAKAFDLQK